MPATIQKRRRKKTTSRARVIESFGPILLDHEDAQSSRPRLHRRVHSKVKQHYYKHMPQKKRYRVLVWVIFFVCSAVIAAQLLYPADRALPLVRLHGDAIGFEKEEDTAFRVQELFNDMGVRLTVADHEPVEAQLPTIGGEIDTSGVLRAASEYPFWQRFIPFSILVHIRSLDSAAVSYNVPLLNQFAETASRSLSSAPQNARVSIEDGRLSARDDVAGQIVTSEQIVQEITWYQYTLGDVSTINLTAEEKPADTTAADLSAVRHDAAAALERTVQMTVGGKTFTPDRTQRAAWLEIAQDDNNHVVLRFDEASLKKYLIRVNKNIGTDPGTTVIGYVDGKEVTRTKGATGRELDYETVEKQIKAWIMRAEGTGNLTVQLRSIKPHVRYEGTYSSTQKGLQAYLDDAARNQNASIVVQQLDGKKWQARADASVSAPSASTYKLYVAWMLFAKMDEGSIDWNSRILDTTVSGCFDRMTIASTNPCAERWIADFGRTHLDAFLHSHGYSKGTTFNTQGAVRTTANDLAKFMVSLERGENIRGAHRDRLLHSLSVHPYRQGVPSGSAGRVSDKVGFLWDYTHDAAIVHHPKGTYVITVMTKGRSYATIAEITRRVEKIMYN